MKMKHLNGAYFRTISNNMKSEFHSVINEFKRLHNEYNFKCPKKLWYDNLVVLCKHIVDIYYCYVIARVYKQDGSLETTMWVGVINRPDDGLNNLSANIKIQIGYNQNLDENFFKECQNKIINIIESGSLTNLLKASQKELEIPSVSNKRYEVYTQYLLPFYKMVLEQANYNKKTLNRKKDCQVIIEHIFDNLSGDMKLFFLKLGLNGTIDKIWELCYIYSL